DSVHAAFGVLARPLMVQSVLLAVGAAVVALVAGRTARHGWAAWPELVRHEARNLRGLPVPRAGAGTRTVHAVRATLLLAVGLVAVLDPHGAGTVAVMGAGAVALYLAVVETVAARRSSHVARAAGAPPPLSAA